MEPGKFDERPKDRAGSSPLVEIDYEDPEGRWWVVRVPEGRPEDAPMGIVVGPPDLSPLDLPYLVSIRLHNQLFQRRILTKRDLRQRGKEIQAALQAAYRVDHAAVTSLYV